MRFTHAYAGAPVCAPSRCVLMTGLHTGHARIRDNNPIVGGEREPYAGGREGGIRLSLTPADHTVAELLRGAGYATGITGKWGLGEEGSRGTPIERGFDEWLGYLNQNHAEYYYTDYLDENRGRRAIPENAGGERRVDSNDLMADFAAQFIRRHRDRPFFLYLPHTIPHQRMEVPDLGDYAGRTAWPEDARIYAAMVSRLDGYVGRMLALLEGLGLANDTIVFFSSDNGPLRTARSDLLRSSGGLRGYKSTLYEGGLRVPMIVRWPGQIAPGHTSSEPWMFADFYTTCAELAGARSREHDGRSIVPVLTGAATTLGPRPLYWEFPRTELQQAVRLRQWKAVRLGPNHPIELYDLPDDPTEKNDVAGRHADVVEEIDQVMRLSHQPSPHWPSR